MKGAGWVRLWLDEGGGVGSLQGRIHFEAGDGEDDGTHAGSTHPCPFVPTRLAASPVIAMNTSAVPQIVGNLCAAVAAIVLFVPFQSLLHAYWDKHVNDDRWVTPALYSMVPLWLLLAVAMACMTAVGGFDWLRLGRAWLYPLVVVGTLSMGTLMFIGVGLYIRPGFTPRILYTPIIYLVPLSTLLLVVLGLNARFGSAVPIQWLRLPWTGAASIGVLVSIVFLGPKLAGLASGGVAGVLQEIGKVMPSSKETLDRIAKMDPEKDFESLLWRATRSHGRQAHEAATARLRSHPDFLGVLASMLESGHFEPAIGFVADATFSQEEVSRLARPARLGMERWVERMPAPNFTTGKHFKEQCRWGTDTLRMLSGKFAGSGVDFGPVTKEFRKKADAKP